MSVLRCLSGRGIEPTKTMANTCGDGSKSPALDPGTGGPLARVHVANKAIRHSLERDSSEDYCLLATQLSGQIPWRFDANVLNCSRQYFDSEFSK
jgi:hypothetical protein